MKIVVPFYMVCGNNRLDDQVVSGGIDKFIQSIYLHYKEAEILIFYYNADDRAKRTLSSQLIAFIEHHNADVLIVNYDSKALINNIYNVINIPILWITHNCTGGIGRINQVTMMNEFEAQHGTLAMVSNFQFVGMNKLSNRINQVDLLLHGGVIPSSFATGSEIVSTDITHDLTSIGRCNFAKNPFLAHQMSHLCGLTSHVHTNFSIKTARDIEYYESNQHWRGDQTTFVSLKHADVMTDLSRSAMYLSAHIAESWGIVIFESLARGVPVLQKTDFSNTHAIDEIAASPNHYTKFRGTPNKVTFNQIVSKYQNMSYSDRLEISEATKEKHSMKNWCSRLSNAIDITIEKNRNKAPRSSNDLSVFF